MLTDLWDMKGLMTIVAPFSRKSINSASYCQLLTQNSPYLLNNPCTNMMRTLVIYRLFDNSWSYYIDSEYTSKT